MQLLLKVAYVGAALVASGASGAAGIVAYVDAVAAGDGIRGFCCFRCSFSSFC